MAKPKDGRKPWERTPVAAPVVVNQFAPLQSFFIICEGAQTEKNYFEAFRANKRIRDFQVQGVGANTLSLVQKALGERAKLEAGRGAAFDQSWCVFDRDSFPAQNFNAAIQLALKEGFRIAYSNEAFELWYLLHFDFHNAAISRADYGAKLSEKLGYKYQKNSLLTYSALQKVESEAKAMRFADNLLKEALKSPEGLNPEKDNPTTTVHLLVRELRKRFVSDDSSSKAEDRWCEQVHEALRARSESAADEVHASQEPDG